MKKQPRLPASTNARQYIKSLKPTRDFGLLVFGFDKMVGTTGFEPATSTTPRWRATGLRQAPICFVLL